MKRALLCITLLLSLCLLCGCGETAPEPLADGETYLEGFWYTDTGGLHVAYSLFSDGGGFLFVGETAIPIRYGISGDSIYISDNGNVEIHPFRIDEDGIRIDDMLFLPMEEDPEVSAAVESMREEQRAAAEREQSAESTSQTVKFIVQLVTLAAAAGVLVILVRFLRKRRKQP